MKYIFYTSLAILAMTICSCDCLQHVQGVVVDASSGLPLDSVKISLDKETDALNLYSGTTGQFNYTAMTGGFLGRPKIVLSFEKDGYKLITKKFKSCCRDNDKVLLQKVSNN